MPEKFSLTAPAEVDLDEALSFVAADSVRAALRLQQKLFEQCRTLATNPGMGRQRPELEEGIRSWPVGSYVIFYRARENGIEVLRVLHGARDLPGLFE